ncbi:hypothetical protein BJ138DRAFT_1119269 [Hygrophoropsis aurantiaca]|uniref:Uncharacterized protein n=1 Tax=Hygrophoropsis aurantiaca TaxID=72124 RepID=A0ACB7ZU62_9AGAM|nr:hypothetical protein BJ138DRAFT_1119269 [Hygrophoropsis aurantiaca]
MPDGHGSMPDAAPASTLMAPSLDSLDGSSSGGDGTSLGPIDDPMLLSPDPYGDELDFDEPTPK